MSCSHSHASDSKNFSGKSFLIAIVANSLFVVLQLIIAQIANSTSLFADAVHNLGDEISLGVAWVGNFLLTSKPTLKATYGLKKASILAALINVVLLVFTCGIIVAEAINKFFEPTPIDSYLVMIVAGVGVIVNAVTALLFLKSDNDLNIRAAFLHLASDAFISLGVVITALLLIWTKWLWLDPVVGLLIAVIILKGTWRLLIDSTHLIIDGVPNHISVDNVKSLLLQQDGVTGVHDLHIWAMSTKENALSAHLVMPRGNLSDEKLCAIRKTLLSQHNISHSTIQVESSATYCTDLCKN